MPKRILPCAIAALSLAAYAARADEPDAGPPAEPAAAAPEPFTFADFGWLNGNSRQTDFPLDGKIFSGQVSVDANYTYDFAHPQDHSLVGSTTSGRAEEFQLSDFGVGGDFHYKNVHARLITQLGLYSTMQPRNDSSPSRGQWNLADAYRYVSEAYGGYHWDILHGINLDVGIFMSYIGLCSYYDFENWVYQESYVSANTPFFFNGARVQVFPTDRLKIELWLINGWQSYGTFNGVPGIGAQVLWRPNGWLSFVSNEYVGADTMGTPDRVRIHDDTSLQIKYYENASTPISRMAFSLTADIGCEWGGGNPGDISPKVSCFGGNAASPSQYFAGFMLYDRTWFFHHQLAVTLGGGAVTNPGRYLVLLPAINGATASSGTPYFTQNAGDKFLAWDASLTVDLMFSELITFRWEANHRESSVPYFVGRNGITPAGGNQGAPGSEVSGFTPDLQKYENRMQLVMMVRI